MRVEGIGEKKPNKQISLSPLEHHDLNINLNKVLMILYRCQHGRKTISLCMRCWRNMDLSNSSAINSFYSNTTKV